MFQHRLIAAMAATALAMAGCTSTDGTTDKAGGDAGPTTLTMIDVASNLGGFPAVQYFIDRVGVVSDGQLTIDLKLGWTDFAPDAEQQIVEDVADGEADLARIGTRAFDRLGVTDFQALTAPLLIDSYPLQEAVINSDIPTEMLEGLEPLGVTGLGVLAGQLRRPAASKPLLTPADWRGLTIETRASDGEVATVEALGATATEVVGPTLDEGLGSQEINGLAVDLLQFDQNGRENTAPYVTANVNLWPQTLALIINSDRLSNLTDQQRDWLQKAAGDAVEYSTTVADQDPALLRKVCERGARFATASDTQLAALRNALEPVYEDLERNPTTARHLDQIRELKADLNVNMSLTIPKACTGPAPIRPGVNADPGDTSALNGTYRYTLTAEDEIQSRKAYNLPPPTEEELAAYPNTLTVTLRDGSWTGRESSFPGPPGTPGTYAVNGNVMTWYWPEGGDAGSTYTFTRDADGTLHLASVPGNPEPGSDFIMTAEPWTKID